MDTRTERNWILFLFFMGIIILTIGGGCFYLQLQQTLNFESDIQESYRTINAANQAQLAIDEAAMDVSRFLHNDPNGITNLSELIISAKINLEALQQLTEDNRSEQATLQELQPIFNKKIDFLNKIISQASLGDQAGAVQIASDPNRAAVTAEIDQKIIDVRHVEVQQLQDAKMGFQKSVQNAKITYLAIGILCIFLFLTSYITLRHYLK